MKAMTMRGCAALAALAACAAQAGGAAGKSQASAGGTQVSIHSSTNVSANVIVQTVGPGGARHVQVFGGGAGVAKAGEGEGVRVTWLGVTTESSSDELRAQLSLEPGVGLTVFGVAPDSPAAKAGLQNHDVLVRFGDQILMDPDQLRNLVRAKKAGDTVKLAYLRKGKEEAVPVTLGEREDTEDAGRQVISLGDVTIDVAKFMKELPKFDGGSSRSFSFSTNWSFGGAGGGAGGSGGSVITFGGSGGGACDPAEVMKSLKLDDENVRKIVEDALKAASQARQPGSQK